MSYIWWELKASSRDKLEKSCAAILLRFQWHNEKLSHDLSFVGAGLS